MLFPTACTSNLDVAFIIDGSGSIRDANPTDQSYDNWNLLLTFVANVADNLPVSVTGTHVGAVVFSDIGEVLFPLSRYTNRAAVRAAILDTSYPGGNTNTSGGLYLARTRVFSPQNGDRPNVPNIAIVLTDGKSTFDQEKTIPFAQDLRNDGAEVVVVGVTNSVDEDELRLMSSLPQRQHENYFTSANFQELEDIMAGLVKTACVPTMAPPIIKSKCDYTPLRNKSITLLCTYVLPLVISLLRIACWTVVLVLQDCSKPFKPILIFLSIGMSDRHVFWEGGMESKPCIRF